MKHKTFLQMHVPLKTFTTPVALLVYCEEAVTPR